MHANFHWHTTPTVHLLHPRNNEPFFTPLGTPKPPDKRPSTYTTESPAKKETKTKLSMPRTAMASPGPLPRRTPIHHQRRPLFPHCPSSSSHSAPIHNNRGLLPSHIPAGAAPNRSQGRTGRRDKYRRLLYCRAPRSRPRSGSSSPRLRRTLTLTLALSSARPRRLHCRPPFPPLLVAAAAAGGGVHVDLRHHLASDGGYLGRCG